MAYWKALYTNRGLCECVANSLMRAVLNTAMGDARLLQRLESVHLVRSSSFFSYSTHINSLPGLGKNSCMGGRKMLSKFMWNEFNAIIERIELEMCISCISVTDKVTINERNTSIATRPLYLYTEFDAIDSYLKLWTF